MSHVACIQNQITIFIYKDIDECIIAKEDHDRNAAEYDDKANIGVYKCVSEDAACRNTIGSYECSCLVGYIGNPESTITCNVDGCPDDHGCIPEPCDLGYYGSKSHGCYKMPEHSVCKVSSSGITSKGEISHEGV